MISRVCEDLASSGTGLRAAQVEMMHAATASSTAAVRCMVGQEEVALTESEGICVVCQHAVPTHVLIRKTAKQLLCKRWLLPAAAAAAVHVLLSFAATAEPLHAG
jgi:hypothetical protein